MRQFVTIAVNALMELVRQPIYLILMTAAGAFTIFISSVYYFGFGEDQIMVKQSALAIMLVTGLFAAVYAASVSVAQEIRTGTALAVLAKPVGRATFLLAKFAGVAGALAALTYGNLLAALCASRMAYDVYGEPDRRSLAIYFGCVTAAYLIGGLINFFLRRPFVVNGVFAYGAMVTLAFVIINFSDKEGKVQAFGTGVDWRLIPAGLLILLALWLLAGLAIVCTTRWDLMPTLAFCCALFLAGLMSDYFLHEKAMSGEWWASVLYTLFPNWQVFWLADALEPSKTVPWSYVGKVSLYVAGYLGAALALALWLFEERELA